MPYFAISDLYLLVPSINKQENFFFILFNNQVRHYM